MDQEHIQLALMGSRQLRNAVAVAMRSAPRREVGRLQSLAVYLHTTGFLQGLYNSSSLSGSPRAVVRRASRIALAYLRAAGLLPTGLFSWLLIRWVIAPFIARLLEEWLFGFGVNE